MLQSCIFSIIAPVFSVTWSFRNHSNMLICCSRNIYYYYQCWKQLCCLTFLWKPQYFFCSGFFDESKKKNSFEIKIFCNIIHVYCHFWSFYYILAELKQQFISEKTILASNLWTVVVYAVRINYLVLSQKYLILKITAIIKWFRIRWFPSLHLIGADEIVFML